MLLDECVPRRLKRDFIGHEVSTTDEAGFKGLKNGNLLRTASEEFDVLITVDKNIEHQQGKNLPMAVLILSARSNRYESLAPLVPNALKNLENVTKGKLVKVEN